MKEHVLSRGEAESTMLMLAGWPSNWIERSRRRSGSDESSPRDSLVSAKGRFRFLEIAESLPSLVIAASQRTTAPW